MGWAHIEKRGIPTLPRTRPGKASGVRWLQLPRCIAFGCAWLAVLAMACTNGDAQTKCVESEFAEPPTLACGERIEVEDSECEELAAEVDFSTVNPVEEAYAEFWRLELDIPKSQRVPLGTAGDCSIRPDNAMGDCCDEIARTARDPVQWLGPGFWECLPNGCVTYGVRCDARGVSRIGDASTLLDFLGPIDTPFEAALVASTRGYSHEGRVCEHGTNFRMLVKHGEYCPDLTTQRLLIEVSRDASVSVIEAEVPTLVEPGCHLI